MLERQRITAQIYSDIGSTPKTQTEQLAAEPPAVELYSDAMSANDLPNEISRTPVKGLASLGTMDVYLGSSPTPQARPRSQLNAAGERSTMTSNAVRTMRLDKEPEDFGSSPPRFDKDVEMTNDAPESTTLKENMVTNSFERRQPDRSPSVTFDDVETSDEDVSADLPNITHSDELARNDDEALSNVDLSDSSNSSTEVQLTAQINAEVNARIGPENEALKPRHDSNSAFVNALSQKALFGMAECPDVTDPHEDPTNSFAGSSLVRDSFPNPEADDSIVNSPAPRIHSLRRSTRASVTSNQSSATSRKKRKQPPIDEKQPILQQ